MLTSNTRSTIDTYAVRMSDPRFRPRSSAAEESAFGKALRISWYKPTSPSRVACLAAAQLQHRYAVRINNRLRELGKSVRDYSEMAGVGYDRMTKVLRGEAVMRLEDVTDAERLLGKILSESDAAGINVDGENLVEPK